MKILADQDVYRLTVEQLKQWGHDVITAKELGIHKSPDEELLKAGRKTRRLLITRDKDFGSLIFLRTQESVGVILLRMGPKTIDRVHSELHRLFHEQDEEILKKSFCVVESKRYRIRRLDKGTKS